jgi:hypothetical protein
MDDQEVHETLRKRERINGLNGKISLRKALSG